MFHEISNNIKYTNPQELNALNEMMDEFQKSCFGAILVLRKNISFSTHPTQHTLNYHELRETGKKLNKRRKKCKPTISEDSLNTT